MKRKRGDDVADNTADIGVAPHGDGAVYLASLYNKRHNYYAKFVCLVAKHIVQVHEIHRELVRIEEAKVDRCILEAANQWKYKALIYCEIRMPGSWSSKPLLLGLVKSLQIFSN